MGVNQNESHMLRAQAKQIGGRREGVSMRGLDVDRNLTVRM